MLGKRFVSLLRHLRPVRGLGTGGSSSRLPAPISGVTLLDKSVDVAWQDGDRAEFANVWLRDNCQCSQCYHPVSKARLLLMSQLNVDETVQKVDKNSTEVTVTWSDGHTSTFQADWLRARVWRGREAGGKVLWGKDYEDIVYEYNDVIGDERRMLSMLEDVKRHGLLLVKNSPRSQEGFRRLCHKVSYPRLTHFGHEFYVKSKHDPNNLAYTSSTLGLHLDLPYYNYIPGVQILHCIKQHSGEGGDNQFVDAFAVAEKIRAEYPEDWRLLTTVPVPYWDEGEQDLTREQLEILMQERSRGFCKKTRPVTISLDESGAVTRVCFSNQSRDSVPVGDAELTRRLYKSLKLLNTLSYSKEFVIERKMEDGDMFVFDNYRIMHGRTGYKIDQRDQAGRLLHGMYFDWDEVDSRIQVLKQELAV